MNKDKPIIITNYSTYKYLQDILIKEHDTYISIENISLFVDEFLDNHCLLNFYSFIEKNEECVNHFIKEVLLLA